jgi:hypothetical protein
MLMVISNGQFKKNVILYSVGFGVSTGLVLGTLKIIFSIPLIWFILPLYPLAVLISFLSEEDVVNVAWDCAGVTTGPVTVPLLLALCTGIAASVSGSEEAGFGMLTLSSLGPILSVLIIELVRRSTRKPSGHTHTNSWGGESAWSGKESAQKGFWGGNALADVDKTNGLSTSLLKENRDVNVSLEFIPEGGAR